VARRSAERDTARAEYIERRSRGEEVNLAELADRLGVKRQTLRNWKSKYKWDEAVPPPPKKKRGGQPGNKNSKGKKNAAGSHPGAPTGNKNAEKDGAYSAVFLDMLTDQEREIVEKTPLEVRAALEHEMKILKFREHKILEKIAEYEKAEEDDKQKPHKVDGYTDGVYNYYAIGKRSKTWYVIHPVYGLSIVWMETRQAAQARALELSDKIRDMASKPDARLQAYADMIKAAQDGGNLSLF